MSPQPIGSVQPVHISTVATEYRQGSTTRLVYEPHGMCVCPKPTPRDEGWGHQCLRCHRPVAD